MTTVKKSIVISARREDIRPLLHDPKSVMERDPNVYHYQPDENWPAVGAKLEAGFKTFAFNIDTVFTCMEYDPQTMHIVYRGESKNFDPAVWEWTFDENGASTAVSVQIDYTVPGSYLGQALDKLVVERQNAKQTEDTLAGLKAQVEGTL